MNTDELLENFALIDSMGEDPYRYLIDLGEALPPLTDVERSPAFKVDGCQSQVWLVPDRDGGRLIFRGDSDSTLVKGLIAILFVLYDRKTPQEILAVDADGVFRQLGLGSQISAGRRNGFQSMVRRIRAYAEAALKGESKAVMA